MEKMYKASEVAEILGISKIAVYGLIKQGLLEWVTLPGTKNTKRIKYQSLKKYIDSCSSSVKFEKEGEQKKKPSRKSKISPIPLENKPKIRKMPLEKLG